MSSNQLPNDLIVDILSRLIPKDLLRFKCVSKSWYALINNPYFIKNHLERSIDSGSNANLSLIFSRHDLDRLYMVDLNNDLVDSHYTPIKFVYGTLEIPVCAFIGSCNGLVCVSTGGSHFTIWNFSTRNSHRLQLLPVKFRGLPPLKECGGYSTAYGFGHDRFSDDYKVIELMHFYKHGFTVVGTEARVYSLKANSWEKKSRDFPSYGIGPVHQGTFVNTSNALHWIINEKDNNKDVIVAFDLGVNNEYRELQEPANKAKSHSKTLGVLRGCLCMFFFNDSSSSSDIWIMKEYGVTESWTRLISIAVPSGNQSDHMIPLTYSKGGDKILLKKCYLGNCELKWYDLTTKEVEIVEVSGLTNIVFEGVCLQTLVPVNGGSDFRNKEVAEPASSQIRRRKK